MFMMVTDDGVYVLHSREGDFPLTQPITRWADAVNIASWFRGIPTQDRSTVNRKLSCDNTVQGRVVGGGRSKGRYYFRRPWLLVIYQQPPATIPYRASIYAVYAYNP